MERRVSVNDDPDLSWKLSANSQGGEAPAEPESLGDAEEPPELAEALESEPGVSYGPCLYLGSSGERCGSLALSGGYCAKHHPDEEKRWPGRSYRRVLLASIALLAILWPYFQDALQLIVRLVRELQAN
jgi:hypothetical protein